MTAAEKRRFIRELSANVQRTMLDAVPNMPQAWDGIELRELAAVIYDNSRSDRMRSRRDQRRRQFDNDRATRNLP